MSNSTAISATFSAILSVLFIAVAGGTIMCTRTSDSHINGYAILMVIPLL